jgi:uncharacterized membrane protein YhaH (DUF805 family)
MQPTLVSRINLFRRQSFLLLFIQQPWGQRKGENMNWYLEVLKKYAVFNGRARRKEYWMFLLFNLIISFIIGFVEVFVGSPGYIGFLYYLAVIIPGIAVTVRRLHDTERSGWWLLIGVVPIIGAIMLFVFMVLDSKSGLNKFGANPKEATA